MTPPTGSERRHKPFVPESLKMKEFTGRALMLGLVMTIVLGAANAYLGLKAGQTIAATYPAAVIGMAVLRLMKGSILEENIARTAGSIGESVAAGAVFTIPAFFIVHAWVPTVIPKGLGFWASMWLLASDPTYKKATALMVVGSVLGVLFVSLIRRVMVEDPELPFPESVAASEIHKAGQMGASAAKYLFYNMGFGAAVFLFGQFNLFAPDKDFFIHVGQLGMSKLRLGPVGSTNVLAAGGISTCSAPTVSPAFVGVGYIIGPELAALNFSGSVVAWGLMIPLLIFFLGPQLQSYLPAGSNDESWLALANAIWRFIIRPVAVGSMMVGTCYTLFKMRKNLIGGLAKAVAELRGGTAQAESVSRTERYMSSKVVFGLIGVMFLLMCVLYVYLSGLVAGGVAAALVMLIVGFFFATVSGYLVGVIGSSNNPISGLTLSTLVIAALLMVVLGVSGMSGVVAVLGVAAVVCVSSAVAGELLQDFKVGYILGGTPRSIQIVELIAVAVASLVMYFPLMILYQGNINKGGIGFGDKALSAPQAGLMASLAQGIVGGDMAWPLVVTGILFGIAMIMFKVKSPMLVAIGMYLPISITSAIFVGGVIRWITDAAGRRKGYNENQKARVENCGVLVASGLIAGEALAGLVTAVFNFQDWKLPDFSKGLYGLGHWNFEPSYLGGVVVLALIGLILVRIPLKNAGDPNEPAPPAAIM
ncbi:MAG TPA: oligopeptide transporter, OPT family [Candidatus Sulfopaludibacter sp.]|jgi:putative OPT family oligopeptide transporter|nr:oligopeptide transporter, OPT family [Candidatus Sulfopaludibacter sp.]